MDMLKARIAPTLAGSALLLVLPLAGAAQDTEPLVLNGVEIALRADFADTVGAGRLDLGASGRPVAVVMRLDAPMTPEVRDAFDARGIVLESYLGGADYLVSFDPEAAAGLDARALEGIGAGAVLPAQAKVRANAPFAEVAELRAQAGRLDDNTGDRETDRVEGGTMTVRFVTGVSPEEARAILAESGHRVVEVLSEDAYVVDAPLDAMGEIAAIPSVRQIDAAPVPFLPLNDRARAIVDIDEIQRFTLPGAAPAYLGVTGSGVRVGIADSGIDGDHGDFANVSSTGGVGTTRVYAARPGSGGHGTHVASIAGGSGLRSAGASQPAFQYRGVAPEALLGDYASMGGSLSSYDTALRDDRTVVTNHSYVESLDGYSTTSEILDEVIRGDATWAGNAIPARPQVWAAGNNGTFAQYGNEEGFYAVFTEAKNPISVGSIDAREGRVSSFSSLGPSFDGRIKPEIMAPGCRDTSLSSSDANRAVQAARSGTQGYTGKCGTSMAAPVVSGVVALMTEAWRASNPRTADPRPASYKAVLVQTAEDAVKQSDFPTREFDNPDLGAPIRYHRGPDYATGHGIVDAAAAVAAMGASRRFVEDMVARSGQTDTFCVEVSDGSAPLRVALAWDDLPGSASTGATASKLVNDLDLSLRQGRTVVRPWILDPLPLTANPGDGAADPITVSDLEPARRGIDRRNVVEVVDVAEPRRGEWRVQVTAHALPTGAAQRYSVASSHPIKARCNIQIVIPDLCRLNPRYCGIFPGFDRFRIDTDVIEGVPSFGSARRVPEICKYVIDCPGCEGSSALCPGFSVRVDGLPDGAGAVVFDERGDVMMEAHAEDGATVVKVDDYRPGEEPFVGLIPPEEGMLSDTGGAITLKRVD